MNVDVFVTRTSKNGNELSISVSMVNAILDECSEGG